jgi:hypothetical protein
LICRGFRHVELVGLLHSLQGGKGSSEKHNVSICVAQSSRRRRLICRGFEHVELVWLLLGLQGGKGSSDRHIVGIRDTMNLDTLNTPELRAGCGQ